MIIMDTDFLSSLLKIDKLELVHQFFNEKIIVPSAVYREIAETELLIKLNKKNFISIRAAKKKAGTESLGSGEAECISLAGKGDLVLMDDRKAGKIAESFGVHIATLPAFLIKLKSESFLSREEIKNIMEGLKKKDFYTFSIDDENILLS